MVEVINGYTDKPLACQKLIACFLERDGISGHLYVGYPLLCRMGLLKTSRIDCLLISPEKGLVAFNLIEEAVPPDYGMKQDEVYQVIDWHLRRDGNLLKNRQVIVDINVVTFAPNAAVDLCGEEDYPLCDEKTLDATLADMVLGKPELYDLIRAYPKIRNGAEKILANASTPDFFGASDIILGYALSAVFRTIEKPLLDYKEAHSTEVKKRSCLILYHNQIRAVMETPDGTQRIRGLSGSGKSTVLALKAAYVHACHPGWRIGVAYSTLSARSYYMNAIGFFYRELTGMSPNWENVTVCQAWGLENGMNGDAGMCQIFCAANFTRLYRYSKDKINLGFSDGFNKACEMGLYDIEARERSRYENVFDNPKEIFDILIIDEAQDFPESFLRLCYAMLRNPKRLVFAYDELQNFRSQPLPPPEDILANFNDGKSFESVYLRDGFKPNSDIVLGGCYGRPVAVLSAAHALAFGIYREPRPKRDEIGLLQMFVNISMWNALGYEVRDGCLDYGKRVVMGRASIDRLDADPGLEEQIVFKAFRSEEEHDAWVVQEIKRNLAEGGLEAHDIMVVVPERLMIGLGAEVIRNKLSQEGIKSHLVGEGLARNEFWDGVFWKGESVPICSLLEARSNEAPMVYVVDAHASFYSRHDTAKARNLLYSAMTRSTGWVRVVGFGKEMDGLLREYERIRSKGFLFDFVYPTREQQSYLRSVFREAGENLVVEEPWRFKRIAANTVALMEEIEMSLEDYEHYYLIRDWLYDKAIGAYGPAKD